MARVPNEHLTQDELDVLVSWGAREDRGSTLVDDVGAHILHHVTQCHKCRVLVSTHSQAQNRLISLQSLGTEPRRPDCPPAEMWISFAGGLFPPQESERYLEHALSCDHCGPLLKAATEDFADNFSADEKSLIHGLQSSTSSWQKDFAERLSKSKEDHDSRPIAAASWWSFLRYRPRLIFVAGAAILAALAIWLGLSWIHSPLATDRLLARAYTEQRSLEIRIPGASYAPMRVERLGGSSNLDKSPSLLKAEAIIGENLSKNPNDPTWLQARARADLLDGNYESAIKSLQRAIETRPESGDLVADLGLAYYLRANSTARPLDYGYSLDALAKALQKKPDDPVVLFNHALACERLFLYTQAKDDWTRYLQLDPKGGWADEAREHLANVERKLQEQLHNQTEPLLNPRQILSVGLEKPEVRDQIDRRVEQYLRAAIIDWLPAAFPTNRPDADSGPAKTAVLFLADILCEKHNDPWLHDLMLKSSSEAFPVAIHELSASLAADERGDYLAAQISAVRAAQLFDQARNSAGQMRATAEAIYSDQLLWEGSRCFTRLQKLREPLARTSYGWLRGQMRLEESNCANLVGDLGTYESAIPEGVREAEVHKYVPLYLRGLGFEALAAASFGDEAGDFEFASKGLALFWSHPADVMKGYNLYFDLDAAADALHLRDLQVALWQEAIVLIDQHPDVLQRAMAHSWSGKAALSASMPRLAAAEFAAASTLFAASPRTTATARDLMDAEVWLANAELQQGNVEGAEKRLASLKPSLDAAPSFDPEIGYYSAEADIALKTGDSNRMETALRPALFLSEWALHSLNSEAGRRGWAEQTRTAYCDAVEWKLRRGDAKSALELWEWYRAADLRSSERPSGSVSKDLHNSTPPRLQGAELFPTPVEVARDLPAIEDRTVAAYAAFADGIALWSYDNRRINFHWIAAPSDRVKSLASRLNHLCADPNSDLATLRASARELYDLLVAPLEGQLAAGRVIVFEPDNLLSSVPWEALMDSHGQYLMERAPIVVAPGLYQTQRLRANLPIDNQSRALIVAVPAVASERLPPLVDAEEEASVVARYFHAPRELRGNAATLKVIREQITSAEIFHFAGHAVQSPQRTGLLLSELDPHSQRAQILSTGTFAPSDLRNLRLIVLSACSTATGPYGNDSATQSLTEYLLSNGVPHVVASRWNVDSRETAEFMSDFYAELFQGNSVANAIRSARLALAHRPASAHPYYWAVFELQGAA